MQKSDASIHGLWLESRVLGRGHIVLRGDRFSHLIELPEDPVRTRSSSSRELPQEHLSRPVSSSRLWTATLSRAPRTCCSSTRGSGPQSSEIEKPIKKVSNHESCIVNPSKWADMSSEEEFSDGIKEHEKGLPENPKASTSRPLLSISARDPHRRGCVL